MAFSFTMLQNSLNMDDTHFHVEEEAFNTRGCILFGAGFHTENIVLPALKRYGMLPEYIVDSNPAKIGKTLSGIPIVAPEKLKETSGQFVLLSGSKMREMIEICQRMGNNDWIVTSSLQDFCCLFPELGCSYSYLKQKEHDAKTVYTLLSDDISKKIFYDVFAFMSLTHEHIGDDYEPETYFSPSLREKIDYSHFVDLGMCRGETFTDLMRFVGKTVTHYTGIECFEDSVRYMKHNILPQFPDITTDIYCMAIGNRHDSVILGKNPFSFANTVITSKRERERENYRQ